MAEPGHTAWNCVVAEPKDAQGVGSVKLTVVVSPGCHHNRITKVEPEGIFVDVGVPKKEGRANIELLGFLAFLFDLEEDQVRLESGEISKGKVVVLSGLKQDKREMIWQLEAKVGQKHEAHFAVDAANAARALMNKKAAARRKELDEFQSLREEALSASPGPMSNLLLGAAAPKRQLPHAVSLKRSAGDAGAAPAPMDASPPDAKRAARSPSGPAAAVAAEGATGAPVAPADDAPGLGGLAAYDSDEDSDEEEERVVLPQPVL